MVSIESLQQQFDEIGVEPSAEVLNKCLDICTRCDIDDADQFVETWLAYSVSKLGGAGPTIENLRDLESSGFVSKSMPAPKGPAAVTTPTVKRTMHREDQQESPSLVIYNNKDLDSVDSEVLGSYGCVTPKAHKSVSRLHGSTPDGNRVLFSPASYSPLTSKRSQDPADGAPSNSGNVVYTFGSGQLLKQTKWSRMEDVDRRPNRLSIQVPSEFAGDEDSEKFMADDCNYMLDSSYERVLILGDRIYEGGKRICRKLASLRQQESQTQPPQQSENSGSDELPVPQIELDDATTVLEEVAIHHVDFPSKEKINILGRIVVHPEKKNDERLAIVDFDELTLRYTKLDFSRIKNWSVFPGQTVVLEGIISPRGNAFQVENVHFEADLKLPKAPIKLGNDLNMVIASGPFTDKDDLLYEKLSDLLTYCTNNRPDVLILTGPFGDIGNPLFSTIAETYEEYFEKIILNIMNSVSPDTEVLIVSHHDDLMSMFVYPSFPYTIQSTSFQNLRFLPDPCIISINGLEIGITTADIVKDLSEAEVTGEHPKSDKIKRAFNYMFHQRTFYPLNPPPEQLPLDLGLLAECGNLPRVPNMMICPGDLKCYIREVHRCVCINPGHLADQTSGEGTFARVVIRPPEAETAAPFSHVVCQVVKS